MLVWGLFSSNWRVGMLLFSVRFGLLAVWFRSWAVLRSGFGWIGSVLASVGIETE